MATKKPAPMVRFSQELFDAICAHMGDGLSLRAICKKAGMPHKDTVIGWIAKNPELQAQYSLAIEARAEFHFEKILDLADKTRLGSKKVMKADGGVEITKGDMVERSRLQIDARKWVLARMNPKKYGDKFTQELTGEGGGPVSLILNGSDIHG